MTRKLANYPAPRVQWQRLGWIILLIPLACTPDRPTEPPPRLAADAFALLQDDVALQLEAAYNRWVASSTEDAPITVQKDAAMAFGRLALAFEQHGWASSALAWACPLSPEDYVCWYLLAQAEQEQARFEPSLTALRKALALQPNYLPIRLQLAEGLLDNDMPTEAASLLQAVDDESNAAVLGLRGRVALASGNAPVAIELLRQALQEDPQATRLRYPLGLALRAVGRESEARTELARRGQRAASIEDPLLAEVKVLAGGVEVLKTRANELAMAADWAQAAPLYAQVLQTEDDPLTRVNLAIALARNGESAKAEAQYRAALTADPGLVSGWFGLGSLLASLDRDTEAVSAYEEAIALHPGELDARFNLANALYRLGEMPAAEQHYRELIERDPSRAEARLAMARVQIVQGRWSPARQTLHIALQIHPADSRIALELARLLATAPIAEVRDGDTALRLAQHLFQRESSLPHAEVLAMAMAETGRFDEAMQLQQQLITTAKNQQRPDLLPGLESTLVRYQSRQAWRME